MNLWPFRRCVTPTDAARTLSTLAAAQRTQQAMTDRQAFRARAIWLAERHGRTDLAGKIARLG
ncbi:MAG: hypothetical protein ACK4ZW_08450 [Blastomonas sp.]